MSQPSAEDAFYHAAMLYQCVDESNDAQVSNVIDCCERALAEGLTGHFAIVCHAMLGRIFRVRASGEDDELRRRLRHTGLAGSLAAARAIEEYEAALRLDAAQPDRCDTDPEKCELSFSLWAHPVHLACVRLLETHVPPSPGGDLISFIRLELVRLVEGAGRMARRRTGRAGVSGTHEPPCDHTKAVVVSIDSKSAGCPAGASEPAPGAPGACEGARAATRR